MDSMLIYVGGAILLVVMVGVVLWAIMNNRRGP